MPLENCCLSYRHFTYMPVAQIPQLRHLAATWTSDLCFQSVFWGRDREIRIRHLYYATFFCSQIAPVEAWRNRCTALPSSLSNVRSDTCCSSSLVGCCLQWCLYARFRACILLLQYGQVTTVRSACFCAFSLAVMASTHVLPVSCAVVTHGSMLPVRFIGGYIIPCVFFNVPMFNVLLERCTWLLHCFSCNWCFLGCFFNTTQNMTSYIW